MIELAAPPAPATAALTVNHDRLDHVISRVAVGDRTAFRRLYAFMALRVWHIVTKAPLGPADADAVARSTFVDTVDVEERTFGASGPVGRSEQPTMTRTRKRLESDA